MRSSKSPGAKEGPRRPKMSSRTLREGRARRNVGLMNDLVPTDPGERNDEGGYVGGVAKHCGGTGLQTSWTEERREECENFHPPTQFVWGIDLCAIWS